MEHGEMEARAKQQDDEKASAAAETESCSALPSEGEVRPAEEEEEKVVVVEERGPAEEVTGCTGLSGLDWAGPWGEEG